MKSNTFQSRSDQQPTEKSQIVSDNSFEEEPATAYSPFDYPYEWESTEFEQRHLQASNGFGQENSIKSDQPSEQPTCVLKGKQTIGPYGAWPDGTPSETQPPEGSYEFDDWELLSQYESPNYSYRMTQVRLCTNEDGDLVGLQSFVGQFSHTTKKQIKSKSTSVIGNTKTGKCQVLNLDPLNNQYVASLAIRYDFEKINALAIQSNSGDVIFAGNFPENYTDKFRTFWSNEPPVGFFGTAGSDAIYNIGEVIVETDCVKKIGDPFSHNSENGIFLSQNEWNAMTGLDRNQTVGIVLATFLVLGMMIGGLVWTCLWFKGKKKQEAKVESHKRAVANINLPRLSQLSKQPTADLPPPRERKQSVKKGKNGQIEIHQEVAQDINLNTDMEIEIEEVLDMEAAKAEDRARRMTRKSTKGKENLVLETLE